MSRYKITLTASGIIERDPSDYVDVEDETIPTGDELLEMIESDVADELFDFLNNNADDISIQVEPVESPTQESL